MRRNWQFLILILLASGCLGARPTEETRYYVLEYDPPRQAEGQAGLPLVLRVGRFEVVPTYDSRSIIYRADQFRRDAYAFDKWRDKPGEMVGYLLARDLRHSALFEAVLRDEGLVASHYTLKGSVEEFYELDSAEGRFAVISLEVLLVAEPEAGGAGRIVFQKDYREQERCRVKNPASLAEAMSQAVGRISTRISRDLYSWLRARRTTG